jgi:hypothetical protein
VKALAQYTIGLTKILLVKSSTGHHTGISMASEHTITDFLTRFGYVEKCHKCGVTIYRMIDKKVQPHLYTADLKEHSHDESKPHPVRKLIDQERRAPGGVW